MPNKVYVIHRIWSSGLSAPISGQRQFFYSRDKATAVMEALNRHGAPFKYEVVEYAEGGSPETGGLRTSQ